MAKELTEEEITELHKMIKDVDAYLKRFNSKIDEFWGIKEFGDE